MASTDRHTELVRKMSATPSRYIETARRQSDPGLTALFELSSVWADVPQLIELGVVDAFLSHLRAEKAPASTTKWKHPDADFAFLALVSLAEMDPLIDNPEYQAQSRAVLDGWPGIFKWCSYIYDVGVNSKSARERRAPSASVAKLFDTLTCSDDFVAAMVETDGCLELVTKLWADVQHFTLESGLTDTLKTLIEHADFLGKLEIHNRVIEAAGGDVDFIVRLVLGRVKKLTKTIDPDLGSLALSWHIDLITRLCQPHPFRRAFFDANVIVIVTSSFVALSRLISQKPTTDGISMMMASCFNFFAQYLEGDDYPSLIHAVRAGFLPAFLDCSPTFSRMAEEDMYTALSIIVNVLPPYLVYRSFIEAVTSAVEKLKTPHYETLIAQPMINKAWRSFVDLLAERQAPLKQLYKLFGHRLPVSCDNIKCRRIDVKHNFKKCAACEAVYYCSPECQKSAWKSSHRAICNDANAGRTKSDNPHLQRLMRWVADDNFLTFRIIAERDFPNIPHENLMPCIDFRCVPEKYSVKMLKPGASGHPGVVVSPAQAALGEAQFQAVVSRCREIPGIIVLQSVIRNGATDGILTTEMSRENFWTGEKREFSWKR
ncbi:hypothetical protein C8R45DRAFT_328397 [Mycena sanguinolenta]|nr:hypothetical protein C8R45DRAFT_328397 [Mycena sanguinolenta]